MATRIKIILSLLFVHMFTCFMTCKTNCTRVGFSFAITNRIYPDNDSIKIGDTIWIEVDAPTKLLDISSNQEVDYSGAANLGSAIQFLKFEKGSVPTGNVTEAAKSFKTYLVIGDSVKTDLFTGIAKNFLFKETNGRYKFKVGFIALEKGDFMISPGDAAGVYRSKDKCTKAAFANTITNTNQHLYIYQESRPGYEIVGYERTHVYCVRVK